MTTGAGREPEERRDGAPVRDGATPRVEVPREGVRAPARDAGETVLVRALEGGTTVIVRENRAAPVVALTLLVEGGSAAETATTNGVTTLLGRVLNFGDLVVTGTGGAREMFHRVRDPIGFRNHVQQASLRAFEPERG